MIPDRFRFFCVSVAAWSQHFTGRTDVWGKRVRISVGTSRVSRTDRGCSCLTGRKKSSLGTVAIYVGCFSVPSFCLINCVINITTLYFTKIYRWAIPRQNKTLVTESPYFICQILGSYKQLYPVIRQLIAHVGAVAPSLWY